MYKVYIEGFPPIITREDGRLNLGGLRFDPVSTLIEGVGGLVRADGITEHTWKNLVESDFFLPSDGTDALGTESNPLHITGEPLSGGCASSPAAEFDLDSCCFGCASISAACSLLAGMLVLILVEFGQCPKPPTGSTTS